MRPVIPVVVSNGKKSVKYEVLIDSGADRCLFDLEVSEAIGINRGNSDIREVFGVTGQTALYYSHKVTIRVGDISFPIEAGFTKSVSGGLVPYGYVGQFGFFERFIVKFDKLKNEVELKSRT